MMVQDNNLNIKSPIKENRRTVVAAFLLLLLLFVCYSNSFDAAWHFDDYHNIVRNRSLNIHDLSLKTIRDVWQNNSRDDFLFNRPLSYFSFALNRYWGGTQVRGYHIVNFSIHFCAAFILYLVVRELCQTTRLKKCYAGDAHFIALLSSVLWAVNPIQTQAVTYIVQRMASLAAFFYLGGIYLYIKGREAQEARRGLPYFIGSLIAFGLALGSKENAVLFPVSLFLLEILFFQDLRDLKIRKRIIWIGSVGGFLLVVLSFQFLLKNGIDFFLEGYAKRPFTLWERLLTEPRILIFYLTQIFYPAPQRLSLVHDIQISTSFFDPWTTIPATLLVLLLIGVGLVQIRRRPVVSFAILFFFLNHAIESTFIPLELFYEHRNYLPSAFLFFPVVLGLKGLMDYYKGKERFIYGLLTAFIPLTLIGLGTGTYIRNTAWVTEKSLWEDVIQKAPDSSRGYHNLAWSYYERISRDETALKLYETALTKKNIHMIYSKAVACNNIAAIYYRRNDYETALTWHERALRIWPQFPDGRLRMVLTLVKLGRWEAARAQLEKMIALAPDNPDYLNVMGFVLLKEEHTTEALSFLGRSLRHGFKGTDVLINLGAAFTIDKKYQRGIWFLKLAQAKDPQNPLIKLYLVDAFLKMGDQQRARASLDEFIALLAVGRIRPYLAGLAKDRHPILFSCKDLLPFVTETIQAKARQIESWEG